MQRCRLGRPFQASLHAITMAGRQPAERAAGGAASPGSAGAGGAGAPAPPERCGPRRRCRARAWLQGTAGARGAGCCRQSHAPHTPGAWGLHSDFSLLLPLSSAQSPELAHRGVSRPAAGGRAMHRALTPPPEHLLHQLVQPQPLVDAVQPAGKAERATPGSRDLCLTKRQGTGMATHGRRRRFAPSM